MNYRELFDEFWYDYMNTGDFEKLWIEDINDSQRYAIIASEFVKWLTKKGHIVEK